MSRIEDAWVHKSLQSPCKYIQYNSAMTEGKTIWKIKFFRPLINKLKCVNIGFEFILIQLSDKLKRDPKNICFA